MSVPRLHPNTVAGVLEGLEMTFGKNIYADRVVERLLRQNKKWGSRDRSFVAEHTYEIVRWWGLLWALLGEEPSTKRKSLQKLFAVYWLWRGNELPDWPKFASMQGFNLAQRLEELRGLPALQSYAHWFHDLASEALGDKWPAIAAAMNEPNTVNLRVNTLKADQDQVIEELADAGLHVAPHPVFKNALSLEGRPRLNGLSGFQEGLFEVQDAGSQCIAPYLNPAPGSVVIDACAGAGGKTLHLGALMNNQGTLIAMDVEGRKLGELKKRTARAGLSIVETRAWEEPGVLESLEGSADYLLLDVPCSGSGVIKREPDTKWKLQPEHLQRLDEVQKDILTRYPRMLKPGGTLVYATCSILPQENRAQVDYFLEHHPQYELIEDLTIDPDTHNDGFYMAKIQKRA